MKLNSLNVLALAATVLASFSATSTAGPSNWPPNYVNRVTTKAEVMKCCAKGEKVALACKDCNTVNAKKGEDKNGILAWFVADSKHGCSGCGGKISVSEIGGGGKGATTAAYKHTCSKCGPKSAMTCATHKI